ncbi:hypothetical protein J2W32_004759 [Variovorax boronicumulans]|uniref:Serine/threonine protein kinase n=2 Tax=Comamonadaceae TaxID=80864 RepID=A0AAW8D679_9BURK|nr:hypothetical protein [Variovorax boronicumulans]MDP9895593.1 hypothetical protein [Variovorax boronicumulans]MDQ0055699.1 hypothetical protein [Variovorax boronicumulans]
MTQGTSPLNSGDGSRPTTDGTVDNIGGGERFVAPDKEGERTGPQPHERFAEKRKDVAASKKDDSDAFHLHEDLDSETNEENPPPAPAPAP